MPLLFIHGSFSCAGVWEVNFLPWFARQGWEVLAPSLRGHGGSEGRSLLPWFSLSDYVRDLEQVASALPVPPVLVGHSMGGMVAQRYLRQGGQASGLVLMASVPPYGLWDCTLGMAFREPLLVHQLGMLMTFGPGVVDTRVVRRALFSDAIPDEEIRRYEPLIQAESQRVVLDMLAFDPFPPRPRTDLPALVLGAGDDVFFPASQVELTARAFGTEAVIFPNMAHGMMLEPGWEDVATHIAGWLDRAVPQS